LPISGTSDEITHIVEKLNFRVCWINTVHIQYQVDCLNPTITSDKIMQNTLHVLRFLCKQGVAIAATLCLSAMLFSIGAVAFPARAIAAPLVLDSFDAPSELSTIAAYGQRQDQPPGTVSINASNLPSPVPSGARDVVLAIFDNPVNSFAAVAVGNGSVSTAQGTGVVGETVINYGTFTRVGGDPNKGGLLLGLDLSGYQNLRLDFGGAEDLLNVTVSYNTSAPSNPSDPKFYQVVGENVSPPSPNESISVKLPLNNDPSFNWAKVDGISVIINRSGSAISTSYTLNNLQFE
jgi:hypothetical protein